MQQTVKKKPFTSFFPILLFLILVLFTLQISMLTEGMREAMRLCAYGLIPTLFPFLVLTDLFLSLEGAERILFVFTKPLLRPLRLSKYGGVAFFLGAFFGFPMGAKAVAHYYASGALTKEEAERLLLFSGNASPFFLIGSVGLGMMSSPGVGLYLYALELIISLLCGFLLGRCAPTANKYDDKDRLKKEAFSIPNSVRKAVRSSLYITGYVLFFSALCSVLLPLLKNAFLSRLTASFLEIATACAFVSAQKNAFTLPFCAFAVVFSGFSVFFQTADCLTQTDLKLTKYIPVKLICGGCAFFLTILLTHCG